MRKRKRLKTRKRKRKRNDPLFWSGLLFAVFGRAWIDVGVLLIA
jgi:hypothetical protein